MHERTNSGHRDVDMVQHAEKSSLSHRWAATREKLLGQLAPTSWEDGRGRGCQLQRRSHRGCVQPRPLLPVAEKESWGKNLSFFFDLSFFLTRRKNLFYQMFLKILWLHIMYMTYIYGFKKYRNNVHLIYA